MGTIGLSLILEQERRLTLINHGPIAVLIYGMASRIKPHLVRELQGKTNLKQDHEAMLELLHT